ncbi:hypothetical protein R9C00_11820 [Flammeovirgaceae bacterium SG7u.111]|nr:hypothetical protein [Flammeovirgaceae bacterium SG7u.132]WPO38140.1 hypothetical protein R9C00_11820 [Flammeovirgaceae bacterium SG7u.111]
MEKDLFALSPSQAVTRIRELMNKQDYEGLESFESDELDELQYIFSNQLEDYDLDY